MVDNVMLWQFKGSRSWRDFLQDVSDQVDAAYHDGEELVQYTLGEESYTIDFGTMTQFCNSDPTRTRSVRPPGGAEAAAREAAGDSYDVKWQHKGRQQWHDFPLELTQLVETAYQSGQAHIQFNISDGAYIIDFRKRKQVSLQDKGRVRDVRRCGPPMEAAGSSGGPAPGAGGRPAYWSPAVAASVQILPAAPPLLERAQALLDSTYVPVWTRDRMKRAGQASGVPAGFTVLAVERVEDAARWRLYAERRAAVAAECLRDGPPAAPRVQTHGLALEAGELDGSCGECYLLHGAPEAAVHTISRSGFNVSHARSDGLLGAMLYFAENSTKADEYTGPQGGRRALLACRVALGRRRSVDDKDPDAAALRQDLQGGYHSIVAHRKHTSGLMEFGIIDGAQAYPEYLIWYQRR